MDRCALSSLMSNPMGVGWLPPTPLVERSATPSCVTVFVAGSEPSSTKLSLPLDQGHT